MSERIEFRAKTKKKRHELSLPQLTFHHSDHWMKVLGMEVFSAWLMIYTWCDREMYPKDDVSHHKNVKDISGAFGCKVDKAQGIIQKLYEFGLIDIMQERNKFGGMKNIYYWYEIPIYADSMFCELRKCRTWSDRKAHGQELAKLRKIKEEKSAITSRTEKPYGSDNYQANSGLQDKPYGKTLRQPYGFSVHNNYINNNSVVVVEAPREKNKQINVQEIETVIKSLKDATGYTAEEKFVKEILTAWPYEYVLEKIGVARAAKITESVAGFLKNACKNDWKKNTGKILGKQPPPKRKEKQLSTGQNKYSPEEEKRREMIRSLYRN